MLNNVVLMGRLTATPELKQTNSGIEVTSFTIAIDRGYAKPGEERQTDFIDCTAWRGTAKFITSYFTKGQMLAVTGEIQTRNFEDKNGNKRKATEVVCSSASFCGSKNETNNSEKPNNSYSPAASAIDINDFEELPDDDLPF